MLENFKITPPSKVYAIKANNEAKKGSSKRKIVTLLFGMSLLLSQTAVAQNNSWSGSTYNFNNSGINLDLNFTTNSLGIQTNSPYFLFNKEIRLSTGQLGSHGTENLKLLTNGTERVRINNSDGFVGINLTSPQHHLQIHGTTNYSINSSSSSSNPTFMQGSGNKPINSSINTKSSINYGSTGRLSITNTITGSGENDGALFMQAQNNLHIINQAQGNFFMSGGGVSFNFVDSRAYLGHFPSNNTTLASLNIMRPQDNGLRVRATSPGTYGILSIAATGENALIVSEATYPTAADINFKVTGDGEVYGRRFTTTLNDFPDYVFANDYQLMTYGELRSFIATNRHLPNMPTAAEVEQNGADLGEINRLLVEKVEELTLYILELEERLVEMEAQNDTETAEVELLSRIATLESLVKKLINE